MNSLDDTPPVTVEDGLNEGKKDINQNNSIELNDTEVHNEVEEISIESEDKGVIKKNVLKMKYRTLDTYEEVIEE